MINAFGIEDRIIDHNVVYRRGEVVVSGPSDTTRQVLHDDYDAKCSRCWLNHAHSLALHHQAIEDANERERIYYRDLNARFV